MAPTVTPNSLPIVTLKLSHPNFLDAVLTSDGQPIYSLETSANQTTVVRCIGDTDFLDDVASIQWPSEYVRGKCKDKDTGVVIRMKDSKPKHEAEFLRSNYGVMSHSRKFHLPGLDRSLKWRRSQNLFECISPTSSLPIASFEPALLTAPAKLKVFVTDVIAGRNFIVNKTCGVNTLLLDHLVMTSLLLVTHRDDWRMLPSPAPSAETSSPASSSPVSPVSPVTPFSPASSSRESSSDGQDSWYRSPATPSSASVYSVTGSNIVVRPRPRTSPARSSSSMSISEQTTRASLRRAQSSYLLQAQQVEQVQVDSPVLDIRASPTTPTSPLAADRRYSPSRPASVIRASAAVPRTAVPASRTQLRLHVPSTPVPTGPPYGGCGYGYGYSERAVEPQHDFLKTDPSDLPPPYEEIAWTVRVRAPRRTRSSIMAL